MDIKKEKCKNCGKKVQSVLVTATIDQWDADDEQVEEMPKKYRHLIEGWVECPVPLSVGWHLCPECRHPMGEPWIESEA